MQCRNRTGGGVCVGGVLLTYLLIVREQWKVWEADGVGESL